MGTYCFACNLTRKKSPRSFGFNYFLKRISKLHTNLTRATTRQPMLGKYFLQWIRIILDDVWADVRNNETVLTPSFHKLERNLKHLSLKTPPMMPTESLPVQGTASSQGLSKYEPTQPPPPLEGRRSQEKHISPMPNLQLALPHNVGLKQKVDACKRSNFNS